MKKEIGSEFCEAEHQENDKKYFLSGRTALDYIIRDIKKSYMVKSVLLPSYCCHTMIEPFVRNGIDVRFYDVFPDEESGLQVSVPEAKKHEIFYHMLYFGYAEVKGYDKAQIRDRWDIIIDDKTHSWLSGNQSVLADYQYVSYRKWTGFSGIAVAEKYGGVYEEKCSEITNERYCELRNLAMRLKGQYLSGLDVEKEKYLSLFKRAEEQLETDYVGYRPSVGSLEELENLDIGFMKKKRQENAEILINGLKDILQLKLPFGFIDRNTVPLFVPVLIKEKRNEIRNYLTKNSIYCPIHWPLSRWHKSLSDRALTLYDQELSLVCDQRYGEEDMERMVKLLKDYFS